MTVPPGTSARISSAIRAPFAASREPTTTVSAGRREPPGQAAAERPGAAEHADGELLDVGHGNSSLGSVTDQPKLRDRTRAGRPVRG